MNSYATSGGGDNVVTGAISSLFSDSDCQEANESVGKAIRGWYEKCTNFNKTESKSEKTIYMLKIQPEDQHVKKSKAPSLGSGLSLASAGGVQMIPSSLKTSTTKPDTEIVLRLFIELMKLIPFLPTPELVGGQWFIGSYLIHGHAELSMEVSRSLQKIFCENPNMRLRFVI